jgi:hypothetical protein
MVLGPLAWDIHLSSRDERSWSFVFQGHLSPGTGIPKTKRSGLDAGFAGFLAGKGLVACTDKTASRRVKRATTKRRVQGLASLGRRWRGGSGGRCCSTRDPVCDVGSSETPASGIANARQLACPCQSQNGARSQFQNVTHRLGVKKRLEGNRCVHVFPILAQIPSQE